MSGHPDAPAAASAQPSAYDSRDNRKKWPVDVSVQVIPAGSMAQRIAPENAVYP
jgi:hypothetical protein